MGHAEAVLKLSNLLAIAARKLDLVDGPVSSSFGSAKEMSKFLLECCACLHAGHLSSAQGTRLWGIFAPTCDWDDVGGETSLGNEIFTLVDDLFGNQAKD